MLLLHIKMDKEILMFSDIQIEKKIVTIIKVLFSLSPRCRYWESISI